jgi:tRNA G10  N-methylase Trm11
MTIRRSQHLDVVNDDTVRADQHFSARSFDVLVGDLPYGIHHGSTSSGNLARSPADLVQAALPGWRGLLRRGAGLALAWNLKTFPRGDFEDMLRAAGFDVMADAESFDHRVDRSITRGIVLATTR